MGLLEKALKYKKEINSMGRETLIDRIKGPAETALLDDNSKEELKANKDSAEIMVSDKGEPSEAVMGVKDNIGDENSTGVIDREEKPVEVEVKTTDQGPLPSDIVNSAEGEDEPIFTLSEDELKEADEDMSSEPLDTDDIFQLPEMDNGSPLDTLGSQKDIVSLEEEEVKGSEESGDPEESDKGIAIEDQPFGPDDEPVLTVGTGKASDVESDSKELTTGDNTVQSEKISSVYDKDVEGIAENKGDQPEGLLKQSEENGVVKRPEKQVQDFLILNEIGKEIVKEERRKELYDIILFSIMGQIGAASSSIMIPSSNDESRWIIVDSKGVSIESPLLYFNTEDGILKNFLTSREMIDVEKYKDVPEYRDEYYKFISIDARFLSPLNYEGKVIGAIVLGDKITVGDFSEDERDFIQSVSDISAIALNRIVAIENLKEDNKRYKTELDYINEIDSLSKELIDNTSLKRLNDIVNDEFEKMGIVSYSAFLISEDDDFIPILVEEADFLTLRESGFSLKDDHAFIKYIVDLRDSKKVKDFDRVKEIHEAFDDNLLKKMSHFWLYPFKIGVNLIGFLLIFRIGEIDREYEIDKKLNRLSKILFSYLLSIQKFDSQKNRYVDNIEIILKRAGRELDNAKNLKIPLTLILFSIKNFKRYYSLYGYDKARELVKVIKEMIKSRLSTDDFFVRIDRNKILIILPGKDKKYAVPLANVIRNEILQVFKKREMQLLVTFLTAEYPEDGEDLYSLLDSID